MQLKEIRDLFVLFLKQLNKDDVNLFLNYLPIFLEDIQRDPLLLDKISLPAENLLNFNLLLAKNLNLVPPVTAAAAAAATIVNTVVVPPAVHSEESNSEDELKSINNCLRNGPFRLDSNHVNQLEESKNDSDSAPDEKLSEQNTVENEDEVNTTDNILSYDSYDEDEENNYEPNAVANTQFCDVSQIVRSRLPAHIIEYLTKMYNINKYPNSDEIFQMSIETKLTTKKIKNWFDSTRFKLKHSKRNNFTPKVVNFLADAFASNPSPSRKEILQMANETKLTEAQISNWFKQKRTSA